MKDKLSKNELNEIIERRSTGKTSFVEFLDELSKIGIDQYLINVATGQAIYKGEDSELKTEPQVDFVIADHFNRDQALEAIANITLPFLDFLREMANAGITTYTVKIPEKKALYLGMNGEQIEERIQL
ncbi:DUF1398 family protein [Neobacillus drentensis]|uniref:DUF1398 family protein n=1 Tax=Neobacillus drentensis TaxID=220684 RepID=UPI003000D4CB